MEVTFDPRELLAALEDVCVDCSNATTYLEQTLQYAHTLTLVSGGVLGVVTLALTLPRARESPSIAGLTLGSFIYVLGEMFMYWSDGGVLHLYAGAFGGWQRTGALWCLLAACWDIRALTVPPLVYLLTFICYLPQLFLPPVPLNHTACDTLPQASYHLLLFLPTVFVPLPLVLLSAVCLPVDRAQRSLLVMFLCLASPASLLTPLECALGRPVGTGLATAAIKWICLAHHALCPIPLLLYRPPDCWCNRVGWKQDFKGP